MRHEIQPDFGIIKQTNSLPQVTHVENAIINQLHKRDD